MTPTDILTALSGLRAGQYDESLAHALLAAGSPRLLVLALEVADRNGAARVAEALAQAAKGERRYAERSRTQLVELAERREMKR